MAGRRGVAAAATTMTLLLALLCVQPARPHPAHQPPSPGRPLLTTTTSPGRQGGEESGWSLKDTLLRLDDLLQRHNDYNDVMLESGEEDDQLSRLLYRLQHGDRVREGWYDTEPTLPPLANQRLDTATLNQRGRREHRPESTGSTKLAARAPTQKEKKAKKIKG
ncbi:uncharacterized protein LOC127008639 [Eriocheir sinensis]|uniref:uncharacterized protein LOC127008639 n=1 Tax=Eriocheir sinensis TaxID=95602 RepID=UPI0021C9B738|nr:uncharacterized protein LOC127008639 [Eriocheir sinensis]